MTIVYDHGRVSVRRVPFLWFFHYFVVELYKKAPEFVGMSPLLQQINTRHYEADIRCFELTVRACRLLKTIPQNRLWFVFYSSAELIAQRIDFGMHANDVN